MLKQNKLNKNVITRVDYHVATLLAMTQKIKNTPKVIDFWGVVL